VHKGRYELKSNIGAGGMGQVQLAFDPLLQREVAIKLLPLDMAATADQIQRMQREAQALARLNHRNIVGVLDFDISDDGEPFLVMELINGSGLDSFIKRKTLEQQDALEIALQICAGMEHAHDNQLLHRDLKPSNVLLLTNDDGERIVKIIDLGLAKFSASDQKLTQTGTAIGSPYYMSPEQTKGAAIDERSDIYAFGCLLFEMLAGRPPFKGSSAMETLKMQISDAPPTLSAVARRPFDEDLEKIITTCLAKNPDDRYRSFEELGKELKPFVNEDLDEQAEAEEDQTHSPYVSPETPAHLGFGRVAFVAVALCTFVCVSVVLFTTFFEPASEEIEKRAPAAKRAELAGDDYKDEMESNKSMFEFHPHSDGTLSCKIGLIQIKAADEDLKLLENHQPRITELDLSDRDFDGTGLVYLRKHPLTNLNMERTFLNDRGAKTIAAVRTLQKLNVAVNDKLTDQGLQSIASLPNLMALEFGSTTSTAHSFEIVGNIRKLATLTIVMPETTIPKGFVKPLTKLGFHHIGFKLCHRLTRENIMELSQLPYLERITLCEQTISKPIVSALNSLPILELTLSSCSNFEPGALTELKPRQRFQINVPRSRPPEAELNALKERYKHWKVDPGKDFLIPPMFFEKDKRKNLPIDGIEIAPKQ
jgi:serine/threonine protein kinase